MTLSRDKIVGVILAGGQSRRMFADTAGTAATGQAGGTRDVGARDKGLLDLGGRPMLVHVSERLAPQVGRIVLNANGDPARFAALGLPVVADSVEGFAGPLAGVLAGMQWAAANAPDATHIVTVSSDAPFLPRDLVARLVEGLAEAGGGIALAESLGSLHPVIGLWPVALAGDLAEALAAGVRKVLRWTDRHGTVPVAFDPVEVAGRTIDPFLNANTLAELEEARLLLEG